MLKQMVPSHSLRTVMKFILVLLFVFTVISGYDTPTGIPREHLESNRINVTSSNGVATCADPDLARYMNTAMGSFIHNMDALSRNILDQITAFRKPGQWLVHAQIISGGRQGADWQTSTNSQVFTGKDKYACFYHDMQTYILVLRVY